MARKVSWFENYDLVNIITPVNADRLEVLLNEAGYNSQKTQYLVNDFREGFSLKHHGKVVSKRMAPNLKFQIGDKFELWEKVMKEVELKRYAGPYKEHEIPFEHFIQSPIGLVPKDQGHKTRLIFHLSYLRNGKTQSVNAGINRDYCTVRYPEFNRAVRMCIQEGISCKMGKSDMSAAFRNVPLGKSQWFLLILKAPHPITGEMYFFVDKCLPFGASVSCAIFQDFSDAVAFLVSFKTKKPTLNYLDDYFFVAMLRRICNRQIQTFIDICTDIRFPVSREKTFWSSTLLTFLGLLFDSENQVVCIPIEKVEKAKCLVGFFTNSKNKKATVHQIQKLCGVLNFLCRCIVPGRAFLRRTYALVSSSMKPHHHVNITREIRQDMLVWANFLNNQRVYCWPFLEFEGIRAHDINLSSDASRCFTKGFGAVCERQWMFGV